MIFCKNGVVDALMMSHQYTNDASSASTKIGSFTDVAEPVCNCIRRRIGSKARNNPINTGGEASGILFISSAKQ